MFTPIVVTGQLLSPSGQPSNGGFRFQLSTLIDGVWTPTGMTDSSTGEIVNAQVVQGQWNNGFLYASPVGGSGYQPLVLLATDDPTTEPAGLMYTVTEQLAGVGSSLPPWQLSVPYNSPGLTLNIGLQRPTP